MLALRTPDLHYALTDTLQFSVNSFASRLINMMYSDRHTSLQKVSVLMTGVVDVLNDGDVATFRARFSTDTKLKDHRVFFLLTPDLCGLCSQGSAILAAYAPSLHNPNW
jgi:hypothetical protein